MARILVATPIFDGCLDAVRAHELVEGAPGSDQLAEALICEATQRVDEGSLRQMRHLRLIAVAGAGADAIDHEAARARRITVVTAGAALAETTADLAFGLIISASRLMRDQEVGLRAGNWGGWRFVEEFGRDVHGATLGIGRFRRHRAGGGQTRTRI
jgi:lactate dehydrogenase-like 2-hydroxyacid dehydrogenase